MRPVTQHGGPLGDAARALRLLDRARIGAPCSPVRTRRVPLPVPRLVPLSTVAELRQFASSPA